MGKKKSKERERTGSDVVSLRMTMQGSEGYLGHSPAHVDRSSVTPGLQRTAEVLELPDSRTTSLGVQSLAEALRRSESQRVTLADSLSVLTRGTVEGLLTTLLEPVTANGEAMRQRLDHQADLLVELRAVLVEPIIANGEAMRQRLDHQADLLVELRAVADARAHLEAELLRVQSALEEHQVMLGRIQASWRWRLFFWWDSWRSRRASRIGRG